MSRIGNLPVPLTDKINVQLLDDNMVAVKGPKGELKKQMPAQIDIRVEENSVVVSRRDELKMSRALHGLTRALINNMVVGVTEGFTKKLEIVGIGYKAEMKGKKLILNIGYSHPIIVGVPDQIQIKTPGPNQIEISGIDKEMVGLVAAKIRSFRKPEPYKGKGIKYEGEYIRRKAGKAAGK